MENTTCDYCGDQIIGGECETCRLEMEQENLAAENQARSEREEEACWREAERMANLELEDAEAEKFARDEE